MKSITDTLAELEAQANEYDERAVQLRTAASVLKAVISSEEHPVKRAISSAAKPTVMSKIVSHRALEDALTGKTLGEIPVVPFKVKKPTASKKRKYTKKAKYWARKSGRGNKGK